MKPGRLPRDPEDERDLFADIDSVEDAPAIMEGVAGMAAGRTVPHEDAAEWLKTWGAPDEAPPPAHRFA